MASPSLSTQHFFFANIFTLHFIFFPHEKKNRSIFRLSSQLGLYGRLQGRYSREENKNNINIKQTKGGNEVDNELTDIKFQVNGF